MKKLSLIFILFLFSVPANAFYSIQTATTGVGNDSEIEPDCDSIGTAGFLLSFDNTLGTTYACISGGTQNASGGDSPTIDTGISEGSSTLHDGVYTLLLDADGNHELEYTVTAQDIGDLTKGTVEIYFYPTQASLTGDSEVFSLYGDADDYARLELKSTTKARIYHSGSGTVHYVTTTGTFTLQQINVVKASWDVASDSLKIKLNSDATDSEADDLGAIGTNATLLQVGQSIGVINDDYRIDDVRSWSGADDL